MKRIEWRREYKQHLIIIRPIRNSRAVNLFVRDKGFKLIHKDCHKSFDDANTAAIEVINGGGSK